MPEPAHETLEASEPVQLVLRWINAGAAAAAREVAPDVTAVTAAAAAPR